MGPDDKGNHNSTMGPDDKGNHNSTNCTTGSKVGDMYWGRGQDDLLVPGDDYVAVRRNLGNLSKADALAGKRAEVSQPGDPGMNQPGDLGMSQPGDLGMSQPCDLGMCQPGDLGMTKPPPASPAHFDWYKQWYPVAVLDDLNPAMPCAARLLGIDLVVWWDCAGATWRAFQDRCPHRLAPLSEGRIEPSSGHLYCNYHGWQFDGSGKCSGVPQLLPGSPLSSRRSCVTSYPTRLAEGLLWVWPDASPNAAIDSSTESSWPGLAPELDKLGEGAFSSTIAGNHKWYARDLPVTYLAAKENAFNDPGHDIVLHHGSSPMANRANAKPLDMELVAMDSTGYTVRGASGRFQDISRFPCGSRRDFSMFAGVAYVTPTGPGTCRQFHTFLQPPQPLTNHSSTASSSSGNHAANSSASKPDDKGRRFSPNTASQSAWQAALRRLLRPTWRSHLASHVLLDADIVTQYGVDVNRALDDRVYMPAAADAGPNAFLKWLREYGEGGPPVAKLHNPFMLPGNILLAADNCHSITSDDRTAASTQPMSLHVVNRQALLDRFKQHTRHCKACLTAYRNARLAAMVAASASAVSAAAALAAVALLAAGWQPAAAAVTVTGCAHYCQAALTVPCVLAAFAAVTAALYVWLRRLVQQFVFVDYDADHVSKK
eukprot:gene12888-13014_t